MDWATLILDNRFYEVLISGPGVHYWADDFLPWDPDLIFFVDDVHHDTLRIRLR